MKEIVEITPPRHRALRHPEIERLDIGKGFLIPWGELSHSSDGNHAVRNYAYDWGLKLKQKFRTWQEERGVWISRVA